MNDPIRIDERAIGTQPVTGPSQDRRPARPPAGGPSFAETLSQIQSLQSGQGLRFSAHAQTRIQSRQIPIGADEIKRIEGAVQRAAGKGARESLVVLDNAALVVNIPNRTVITVMDQSAMKENVFTNIDSAVFA